MKEKSNLFVLYWIIICYYMRVSVQTCFATVPVNWDPATAKRFQVNTGKFMKSLKIKPDHVILFFYFFIYFVIGLSLLFRQPFGNPPDEYNRFLIPQYIYQHGSLPNGYEESIRIGGYGFSYAFQPILPYMLQGYTMRLVGMFTASEAVLLYAARLVDFVFGLVMAVFVLLLGKKWFADKRWAWLFSFLVMFLPQSIFVHTYVNTDSCCMMSIAILLYGLTKGIEDQFDVSSCVMLSAGIIFCALSYYNAYGYILSCILLFTVSFLSWSLTRPAFDWKPFLRKGIFISVLVLAGIGWWFVRSFLLYDGDILGLRSRDLCASLYALPEFHPDSRVTWQSQGFSLWEMLAQSDFVNLSLLSFIGIYGPMTIVTSIWIYRFYKLLFAASICLCIFLPVKNAKGLFEERSRAFRIFCHANLIFCILMPCALSLYYSYTTDYQPQGRYLLPMLLPFAYYCVRGIQKAFLMAECKMPAKKRLINGFSTGICMLLGIFIVLSIFITVFGYAVPYYKLHPIAP